MVSYFENYNLGSVGTLTANNSPWSWSSAPEEISHRIIDFNPDSVLILGIVSREFKRISRDFVELNTTDIFGQCSNGNSLLSRFVNRLRANHETNLQVIHDLGSRFVYSDLRIHLSESHRKDVQSRLFVMIHSSIVHKIRSLGVEDCAGKILAPEEVTRFDGEAQDIQDVNLQRLWCIIQGTLNPGDDSLPPLDATVQNIRTWMNQHQDLLRRSGTLGLAGNYTPEAHKLTYLPVEIGLFSNLEVIDLSLNRIHVLSPDTFNGLSQLKVVNLSCNQLRILPPGLFNGLNQLERVYLANNRLSALPPHLFRGAPNLFLLYLHNNCLTALSPNLLSGLPLKDFTLFHNSQLLLSYEDLPVKQNSIKFLETYNSFYNYECRSLFAKFYQHAASGNFPEVTKQLFSRLNDPLKNSIFGLVWDEAGRPETSDHQWGEHHVFDDMQIFNGALKRVVRGKFDGLAHDQKNAVYGHVSTLIRGFNDLEWGKHHAHDNVLWLIDAMELLQD